MTCSSDSDEPAKNNDPTPSGPVITYEGDNIVFAPTVNNDSIINPYSGYCMMAQNAKNHERTEAMFEDTKPLTSIAHVYLRWNKIQSKEGELDLIVNEESSYGFSTLKKKGVKLIIRFVADYPEKTIDLTNNFKTIPDYVLNTITVSGIPDGVYYDEDTKTVDKEGNPYHRKGFSPNYSNTKFIELHEEVVKLLADRYNNDPSIAFVELGSVGNWGEWHVSKEINNIMQFPKTNVTDIYIDHYKVSVKLTASSQKRKNEIS